ncbi:MAG: 50S ribosomal protein L25/general stress protein Ctc [Bacteroidales bacterium]|nr:50S ribosomal protein L25/general stress protein Ctc [Bacteroidales bacterium]
MKTFELKGSIREDLGKKATKKVRNQGMIPCVIYGGEKPVHFTAPINDFRNLIYTPYVYIVNLELDGTVYMALLKDLQFHPTSDAILHIDFLQIFKDKPATVAVPVITTGFSEGVKAGGKLKIEMRRLKVKALPKDLPDELTIDVTDISLGQSLKTRELKYDNLELLDPAGAVVVSVKLTRVAKGMAIDEDVEEVEEGEEGEEGDEEGSGEEKSEGAE